MSRQRQAITSTFLRECFDYDAETGELRWRERPRHHFDSDRKWKLSRRHAGRRAGYISDRYRQLLVSGRKLIEHRAIWAIIHGIDYDDVPEEIDHKNLNKLDNSMGNLRAATHGQNAMNKPIQSNNTSGFKGVDFDRSNQRWRARIKIDGKTHYLGQFETAETAAAARLTAQSIHGEFARLS